MKKKHFIIIIFIFAAIMACNKTKQNSDSSKNENTRVSDNIENGVKDLEALNLKGNVKEVREYSYYDNEVNIEWEKYIEIQKNSESIIESEKFNYSDTMFFNMEGKRYSLDLVLIERDELGRIILYDRSTNYMEDINKFTEHYYYSKSGLIDSIYYVGWENESTTSYIYNEQGNPETKYMKYMNESFIGENTTDYTYISFDKNGNWTKRIGYTEDKWYDVIEYDEGNYEVNKEITYCVEEREIIYW